MKRASKKFCDRDPVERDQRPAFFALDQHVVVRLTQYVTRISS
jgi:hypothetical protein